MSDNENNRVIKNLRVVQTNDISEVPIESSTLILNTNDGNIYFDKYGATTASDRKSLSSGGSGSGSGKDETAVHYKGEIAGTSLPATPAFGDVWKVGNDITISGQSSISTYVVATSENTIEFDGDSSSAVVIYPGTTFTATLTSDESKTFNCTVKYTKVQHFSDGTTPSAVCIYVNEDISTAFNITSYAQISVSSLSSNSLYVKPGDLIVYTYSGWQKFYSESDTLKLERLKYYGDPDIVPSDSSYFVVNETGETITGLTDTGKTQTELVIPYKINGKEITSIGNNAFMGCTSLTSVNIPNSITSIRSSTFRGCSSLTSITIPNSVTSIGMSAFHNCTSLTSINIPNSVTSIEFSAFYGCTELTKIEIPNSVTSIGEAAFQGCTNLIIYCEQGSYAEIYAKDNNIPVMYTDISATDFNNKADKATTLDGYGITDAYTKGEIDSKISNVYEIKGSSTVANLPTNPEVGDVYNITDSGTITGTEIEVNAGDNIVYTSDGWDKLSATIDLSGYQEKLTFDNTPTTSSTNPVTSGGVRSALDLKADKSHTLSGYGIEDAYTKTEVNTKLSTVYKVKGSANDYTVFRDSANHEIGDVYNLKAVYTNSYKTTVDKNAFQYHISTDSKESLIDELNIPYEWLNNAKIKIHTGTDTKTGVLIETTAVPGWELTLDDGTLLTKDVYNTVTSIDLTVYHDFKAGDNIVYINGGFWDKLAATVDLSGYQEKLTFDNTPTADSTNPVTSEGIKTALDLKLDKTAAVGKKTAAGGEIFNDYTNNKASAYSHVEGYNTVAGQMGHLITDDGWGDSTSKTYTLTSVVGLAVNDTVSMYPVGSITNNVADISSYSPINDFAKIKAINTSAKTITVDTYQSRQSMYGIIYVKSKPFVGTISIAAYTHAEGKDTKASGSYSHAEGYQTQATSSSVHAEGNGTTASGQASHAEGNGTTASGMFSHAEGTGTTASGNYSHAEGASTIASGEASHAEGNNTNAYGQYSHAEGIGNKTYYPNQHVQGKYNTADPGGNYAHIVGNGTSDTSRSNAHTLDWSGNAWFAGNVRVGGTYNSGAGIIGAKTLATIDDLRPDVKNTIDTIAVNTIYDLGVQTALTINLPSGEIGDFIEFDFISAATATTLTVKSSSGLVGFDLIPETNKIYTLYFDWGETGYYTTNTLYGWRFNYSEYEVTSIDDGSAN